MYLKIPGADPKSIVCAFFKQGQCTKGDKCKFSHDLSIERKAEKRSLYVDMRDSDDPEETMENWDEDKLKEVIEKKHGKDKKMPTTDIVLHEILKCCELFIDPMKEKMQLSKRKKKKRNDYKAGRQVGLSGREMFSFNPELAADNEMEDGDEAFDSYAYAQDDDDDEMEYKELSLDALLSEAREADNSGTVAAQDRLQSQINEADKAPTNGLNEEASAVPINENLFVVEDLDALDDELKDLDLEE
ncbi:zinc finger-containing protein p48znf [Holotrichia oblita]|uniref:Zinc finger-containing protein p48znf n=1 Tax=Holotrichia oblita TaxID=644536 RepID=A0ACB9TUF9_HOLOL|nr:zinc finger-containing protein p48znf [Holotrichia oblita]